MRRLMIGVAATLCTLGVLTPVADAGGPAFRDFSPDVDIRFRNAVVTVLGDGLENFVEVCVPDDGTVLVTVLEREELGVPVLFETVGFTDVRDVRVQLGRGDDIIQTECLITDGVFEGTIERDLVVNLGPGDDFARLSPVAVGDDLTVVGASGADNILVAGGGASVGDDLLIRGNAGRDVVRLASVQVGDRLDVNGGSGDLFYSDDSRTEIGRAIIRGGNDVDFVSLAGSYGPGSRVLTAAGDDEVEVKTTVAADSTLMISTGSGADAVTLLGGGPGRDFPLNVLQGSGDDRLGFVFFNGPPTRAADRFNGGPGTDTIIPDENGIGDATYVSYEVIT